MVCCGPATRGPSTSMTTHRYSHPHKCIFLPTNKSTLGASGGPVGSSPGTRNSADKCCHDHQHNLTFPGPARVIG